MSTNKTYALRRNSRSNSPHRSPLVRRKLRQPEDEVFGSIDVATYNDSPEHLYGLDPLEKDLEDYLRQEKQVPQQNPQEQPVVQNCFKFVSSNVLSKLSQNIRKDVIIQISKCILASLFLYILYKNVFSRSGLETYFSILGVAANKSVSQKEFTGDNTIFEQDKNMERYFKQIIQHDEMIHSMQKNFDSFHEMHQQWSNQMKTFESEQKQQRELIESFQQQLLLTVQAVKSLTEKINGVEKTMADFQSKANKVNVENSKGLCKGSDCNLSTMDMHSVVHSTLELYSADDIALTDFALESAGGRIYDSHHSETCDKGTPIIKVFGLPLWEDPRSPRSIIQPDVSPNHCWSMKGTSGFIVVKLSHAIDPTMVSLQHLDKRLDQYSKETFEKAPREFEVYAWLDSKGSLRIKMGGYQYERNGPAIQTFKLKAKASKPVDLIELRILNNYGNIDCTCIYRFRVHGISYDWKPASTD